MPRVVLNAPAPDFTLKDYNGQEFSLSGLRGNIVLLVFNRGFL
jgi:peroxiredoxin